MRYFPLLPLCVLAATAPPGSTSPVRLTEHAIRAFVERQERLWNRRNFGAFFALTAPNAVFTTERRAPGGTIAVERETVVESRLSAERTFATIQSFRETTTIDRIEIAPDGRSARVLAHEQADVTRGGNRHRLCADTEQNLVLRDGRILSLGQIDRMRSCESRSSPA